MYDVVIIGAGPAGLFSAYELIEKNKNLKIMRRLAEENDIHEEL